MASKAAASAGKKRGTLCVECCWCELELAPKSRRRCSKTGAALRHGEVLHRPGCRNFRAPSPAPHWGP